MLTLEEARRVVAERTGALEAVRVELGAALGRVLREEGRAGEDMPAFDRAAMDGFAVGEGMARFRVVGEVRAGVAGNLRLERGECVRIFTGGEIPEGGVRVVKQEDARVEEGCMIVERECPADYIRRRGEDAAAGDSLLKCGTRLGVAEIGLLGALGMAAPLITRASRVGHFATGDELVGVGEAVGRGEIRDSNSGLVKAFVKVMGGEMTMQERVGDDAARLTARVKAAVEGECDLVLISGGASVGDYDFGRTALEEAGFEIHFSRINLRPGKPLIFATRGRQAAFVLPGNPLSHLAVLNTIARVAFERMAGVEPELRIVAARLKGGIVMGGDGRDTVWPARVDFEEGQAVAQALRWKSSGDITGLAGLNAFIRCDMAALDTGAIVPCILIHG